MTHGFMLPDGVCAQSQGRDLSFFEQINKQTLQPHAANYNSFTPA